MPLGTLQHFTIEPSDLERTKTFKSKNVQFREQVVPRTGDTQVLLYDPDGSGSS